MLVGFALISGEKNLCESIKKFGKSILRSVHITSFGIMKVSNLELQTLKLFLIITKK